MWLEAIVWEIEQKKGEEKQLKIRKVEEKESNNITKLYKRKVNQIKTASLRLEVLRYVVSQSSRHNEDAEEQPRTVL